MAKVAFDAIVLHSTDTPPMTRPTACMQPSTSSGALSTRAAMVAAPIARRPACLGAPAAGPVPMLPVGLLALPACANAIPPAIRTAPHCTSSYSRLT